MTWKREKGGKYRRNTTTNGNSPNIWHTEFHVADVKGVDIFFFTSSYVQGTISRQSAHTWKVIAVCEGHLRDYIENISTFAVKASCRIGKTYVEKRDAPAQSLIVTPFISTTSSSGWPYLPAGLCIPKHSIRWLEGRCGRPKKGRAMTEWKTRSSVLNLLAAVVRGDSSLDVARNIISVSK